MILDPLVDFCRSYILLAAEAWLVYRCQFAAFVLCHLLGAEKDEVSPLDQP